MTGSGGVIHADGALELQLAVAQQAIRRTARQQQIEEYAEGVCVRRGGDGAAKHLLRRGILRRENAFLQACHRERVRKTLRCQQLGDPEIQQLGRAFRRDEDVRRLDVPMDNQIAVRIVHRTADRDEQFDALANEQRSAVTVDVDGLTIDEFHHEVGRAIFEVAAVDQACDRWIIKRGEDVSFAVQAAAQTRMHGRMLQYLDCNGLMILRIITLTAVHGAHAAIAQDRYHPIGTDACPNQAIAMIIEKRFSGGADGVEEGIFGSRIQCQQGLDRDP